MINVTELLKNTEGFDPNVFTVHLRETALLSAGHHRTKQGWFNKKGQFLGKTEEDAIKRGGLQYEQVKSNEFYVINEDDTNMNGGVVAEIHGVLIWGTFNEEE